MKPFFVYLLKCADDSYYAGHTDDLAQRLHQHDIGSTGYTASRRPIELVWQGEFESIEGALAFELQIKGWSRKKKEALIAGDWHAIQVHAWGLRNPLPEHLKASIPQPERGESQPERGESQPERGESQPERGESQIEREALSGATPTVRPEVSKGTSDVEQEYGEASILKPERWEAKPERVRAIKGFDTSARTEGIAARTVSVSQVIDIENSSAQRRAIAKAITLLESTRADHRTQADELLTKLLPHTGKSLRLGISGVPGVGKSTFIEALGLYLIELGHRVAVLTIDPSSTVSGGSILGDKTRMEKLSVDERAYIRPSPSSGTLGGVAEKTREAMLVCEAAGYDIVIVETVGVGQSETAVAGMTDMFVLMQLPNAGDDLQAIKKGVMELADLVLINKSDIDPLASERARLQITAAMQLLGMFTTPVRPEPVEGFAMTSTSSVRTAFWHPKALLLSALNGQGVDAFWAAVNEFKILQNANGKLAARRKAQSLAWMWERIDAGLKLQFKQNPQVQALLPQLLKDVSEGQVAASTAARNLLNIENKG